MSDQQIFTGKFYYENELQDLTIEVTDGVISQISKFRKGQYGITLQGAIFPGFVDVHVHFRDPGETEKEDFKSGSMSAAFGGTTTVFDMPNNSIPIRDYKEYDRKKSVVHGRSYVDYGLYSMYDGTNKYLLANQSPAFKVFMGESTNSNGFNGDYLTDSFLNTMEKPILFHTELASCLDEHRQQEELRTLSDHDANRPPACEKEAMTILSKLKAKTRIAGHVSDWDNTSALDPGAFKEMTPHHMLLDYSMPLGTYGKVNPPLREPSIARRNFQAFLDGKVDILSSDHAPHTERDKEDMNHAKSGMIGVETRVPLMLALVQKKILPLNVLVNSGALNPSVTYGLFKGQIKLGYHADFVAVHFSNMEKLNEDRLHSKTPITPFNGFQVVFPDSVYIRGQVVISEGEIVDEPQGEIIEG